MYSFFSFCGIANLQLAAIMDGKYFWVLLGLVLAGTFYWVYRIRAFRPGKNATIELPPGELYIANLGGHSILGFERTNSLAINPATVRVIKGPATGLHNPFDVAVDGSNRIWVANLGDPPATNPSVTVFEANVTGNALPVLTVPLNIPDGLLLPGSLARRSSSGGFLLAISNLNSVLECSLNSGTNLSQVMAGAQTINPTGIAFNSNQVFVATSSLPLISGLYQIPNPPASAILIFNTHSSGGFNPVPAAMIAGDNTGLSNPAHICFDDAGKLYVVNRGVPGSGFDTASITVYALGQTGNTAPVQIIHGSNTQLNQFSSPYGISVDKNGRIYVSVQNSVLIFDIGATGNVSPAHTLNNADISSPIGLATR